MKKSEARPVTRVLVVDDCRTVILSVRAHLEPLGYLVHAIHALADLPAALRWPPDVVLLDLGLPDADTVVARDQLAGRPVCVYSARPRTELTTAARAIGAMAWVEKGRPMTELRHAIDHAVRRRDGQRRGL